MGEGLHALEDQGPLGDQVLASAAQGHLLVRQPVDELPMPGSNGDTLYSE